MIGFLDKGPYPDIIKIIALRFKTYRSLEKMDDGCSGIICGIDHRVICGRLRRGVSTIRNGDGHSSTRVGEPTDANVACCNGDTRIRAARHSYRYGGGAEHIDPHSLFYRDTNVVFHADVGPIFYDEPAAVQHAHKPTPHRDG